jgi:predicted NAD/FAD-dependent oxidoreductase
MAQVLRIGIVGAGMAGLACAEGLGAGAHRPLLLDKGRGAGGRMATRRLQTSAGETSIDMGAQYFTVRDPAFRRRVQTWSTAGVVAPWPEAGTDAYVGTPTMSAPIREMAERQTVRWATRVVRLARSRDTWQLHTGGGEFIEVDVAVIALPAEQAAQLLAPVAADLAARARATASAPCWAVMLAFAAPVPVTGNCFRGKGALAWAARNSAKPGRTGPESWILQSAPAWSAQHLDADAAWVTTALIAAAESLLGVTLPGSDAQACHRWRYARSGADGSGALWDPERGVGVCGDWLVGPRVEAAWQSGTLLAQRIRADRNAPTGPEDADRSLLVS